MSDVCPGCGLHQRPRVLCVWMQLPRRAKAQWVGEEVHASPAAPSTHLVESWLPEPVLPEQQGLGDGGGQQGGVLARLLHVRPAPLPGAQVEQQ